MDIHISKQKLINLVTKLGAEQAKTRQVAKRLKELLPTRLDQMKRKYQKNFSASKALRLALRDPQYLKYLKEYLDLSEKAQHKRILWETHNMLYHARKTRATSQFS